MIVTKAKRDRERALLRKAYDNLYDHTTYLMSMAWQDTWEPQQEVLRILRDIDTRLKALEG